MEKVVNGVTYIAVSKSNTCYGCAGSEQKEGICINLADVGCASRYIWERGSEKHSTEGITYDADKTQYSLVPPYALEAVAKNLTSGLKKYPHRNNWQLVNNAEERYLDAMLRHIEEHRKGNIYDTDNADPTTTHLSAVAVNSMFLLEIMLNPSLTKEKTNENHN